METVLVAHKITDKCEKKANAIVKAYKRRPPREQYSKGRLSYGRMAEINRFGFIAECAVCSYIGMDPNTAISWATKTPDAGHDIKTFNGATIDVKSSDHPAARRLMWPIKKLHKLPHAADIFVLARVSARMNQPLGQVVELVGWITKDKFMRLHWKANGLRGIVDGTPYLNEKELDDMGLLRQHLNND